MNDDYIINDQSYATDQLDALSDLAATPKIAEWIAERIEKELRGAYRAGYNYVFIGEPRTPLEWRGDSAEFKVAYHAIPSYTPVEEWQEGLPNGREWVWHEYDLTEVSPAEFRAAKRGEL